MDIDRRAFIELTGAMVAAMALPGCASVAITRVTPVEGTITLPLRNYPQLLQPGGYLKIQPDNAPAPIYVLAMQGGYAALSPICTHLGCTVAIQGQMLVCPCHGSTYDRGGRVLRGPAERPLKQYRTTTTSAEELVIQLDGDR